MIIRFCACGGALPNQRNNTLRCRKCRAKANLAATKVWQRSAAFAELKQAKKRGKRFISDVLKAQPCTDCLGRFPAIAMDWDHVLPGKKTSVSATAKSGSHSLTKMFTEINKCELVCSNCHRVRTQERRCGL